MPFVHGKSPQLMKKQGPNFCRIKMLIFIFGRRYGNMFQYRRKVKCMLDTIIVTPYEFYLLCTVYKAWLWRCRALWQFSFQ